MTSEQTAAYVNARAVAALLEAAGLVISNLQRLGYDVINESDFVGLIDKHGLDHNALISLFNKT